MRTASARGKTVEPVPLQPHQPQPQKQQHRKNQRQKNAEFQIAVQPLRAEARPRRSRCAADVAAKSQQTKQRRSRARHILRGKRDGRRPHDRYKQAAQRAARQTGTTFRLRGKGIPYVGYKTRGDQFVTVVVETPQKLNREQKELLRRLGESIGDDAQPKKKSFFERLKDN